MYVQCKLARLAIIKGSLDGAYTVKQAARGLGVSTRWAKALKKAMRGELRAKTDKDVTTGRGELLQAGATPFDQFGGGERRALHGFIDDAAGRIIARYLRENECLAGYLELMRQTLSGYGIPLELYAGKAGIFFVT